ncbi:tigger transposable element-derived protein 2-like isoform X1 [Bolinopsis microptera]|uniref:tigger transposable element-derived protein 2-like isoform X1 n=1 Tax=Bolinopsis microptera TaxID=2820187 RepID=UPI003079DF42
MNKMQFVEVTNHWGSTKQKRRVRASPKNPSKITRMNEAVFQWFKLQRSMNLDVDNGQLCDKALMYSQILKVSLHFTASRGWLTRFKERHGISDIKSTHCKIDSEKVFVSHLKASLRQENLTPGQVYCVDETCLLWKDPPPSPPEYNVKTETEKLTLITCTNMDATHKLSLNILGRYQEPIDVPPPSEPHPSELESTPAVFVKPLSPEADNVTALPKEDKIKTEVEEDPGAEKENQEVVTKVVTNVVTNGNDHNEKPPLFCDATTQSTDSADAEVSAAACHSIKIQSTTTKTEAVSPENHDVITPTSDVTIPPRDVTQPPVLLYRKGETHELTPEVFTDWFYSTFVPQVRESLKARDLPPKAVLIMDNSLYHPEHLSDSEGNIKTIKIPCYVANKSLPSATVSRSLKARYKVRLARGWLEDNEFCRSLSLRRCFELLKEEWGEVNEITSTWKHWYQIEHNLPLPDLHLLMLSELLPNIPGIFLKQWYMADGRPSEVPFRIPNELELLDLATQICHTRLTLQAESPDRDSDKEVASPRSMMELTSDYTETQHSPPAYEDVMSSPGGIKQLPNITIPGMVDQMKRTHLPHPDQHPAKKQRANHQMMSNAKPLISLHPQSIIDNILRASMMSSAGSLTSPTLPPFSPLSPSPTTPDTWPALHALLGITNVKPKMISKNDALIGLDKFIAYVEQQSNVAGILKDVLYEYRKYAMQRL